MLGSGWFSIVVVVAGCWVNPATGQALVRDAPPGDAPRAVISIVNRAACGNCHVIPGVPGADGEVGPSLAEVGKVAATRKPDLTPKAYIRESIVDPDAFAASDDYAVGIMPGKFAKTLTDQDLTTLVDYLATLDGTKTKAVEPISTRPEPIPRSARESQPPVKPVQAQGQAAVEAQVALGKLLFFDRRLSASNALSCASCHQPDRAFTDGRAMSLGYPGTALFRNTPTLLNLAEQEATYWDGRLDGSDLATVVRDHLTEPFFMASDGRLLVERLKQAPAYVERFATAYGSEPSFGLILKAVAAYLGSLQAHDPPLDRYLGGEKGAISDQAIAGKALFEGKARCASCHVGPMLRDGQSHNLALPTPPDFLADPERAATFRRFFRGLGTPNYRNLASDPGHLVVRFADADRGKFQTPSLREVSRTAPYMHDGGLRTLADVVSFYNDANGPELRPLGLSDTEQAQLVAFLETLASKPVKVDEPDLPEYALLPLGRPESPFTTASTFEAPEPPRTPRPVAILPPPPEPLDNPTTPAKVALGKLLYFDPRISADGATSCNTCHPSGTGYTARTAISMGGTGTSHWRNASTLYNVAHLESFNWDGARTTIEEQNDGAWTGALAGNIDPGLAEERLFQIPEYRDRFRGVFGIPYPTWPAALRAVAAYQRTLNSRNVPFDNYLRGDDAAITPEAKRGYALFQNKAGCIQCHDGPLFSDRSYHRLGVPQSPDFQTNPNKQIAFRFEQVANGVTRSTYETVSIDLGLYYVTKRPGDAGKFRTPSLRELKHTYPYMQDGVFRTLPAVVDFYNGGGGKNPDGSPILPLLGLNRGEMADLVAFLESLSGDPLKDKSPDLPPYGPTPATLETRR